ncbi:MAG: hypothetical protein ACTSU5_06585 [Promethearchaeota archaeon]
MAIDDRDEYEELFKKSRWKTIWNVLKGIALIFLMLVSYLLIQLGMNTEGGFTWMMAGFMLLCVGSSLMTFKKPPDKPKFHTLTVFKCLNPACGTVLVRDFTPGDFVYKMGDPCLKCTWDTRAEEIYQVKLRKATREELIEERRKGERDSEKSNREGERGGSPGG